MNQEHQTIQLLLPSTANESEEIFLDENLQIIKDVKHSQKEARSIVIRIISSRQADKKERSKYEKAQKNT